VRPSFVSSSSSAPLVSGYLSPNGISSSQSNVRPKTSIKTRKSCDFASLESQEPIRHPYVHTPRCLAMFAEPDCRSFLCDQTLTKAPHPRWRHARSVPMGLVCLHAKTSRRNVLKHFHRRVGRWVAHGVPKSPLHAMRMANNPIRSVIMCRWDQPN